MHRFHHRQIYRAVVLTGLVLGILLLAVGGTSWVLPGQSALGQTVPPPTATLPGGTPGLSPTPVPFDEDTGDALCGPAVRDDVEPERTSAVTTSNESATLLIGPATIPVTGSVELSFVVPETRPQPSGTQIGCTVQVARFDQDSEPVIRDAFVEDAPLCFRIPPALVQSSFEVRIFDNERTTWLAIPATRWPTPNEVICGWLDTPGDYALVRQ